MSYLKLSKTWAGYLGRKTELSREKEIILTYIIELLVITIVCIVCSLLLGQLLGVLPGTASCLFMIALFRHTAGGAHSNNPWRCAVVTILIFPLIALLADILSSFALIYTDVFSIIAILVGVVTIARLAPVDSPAAPIISPTRRKKLKTSSIAIILMATIAVVVLRQSSWTYAGEIQISLVIGILWVSLILSKLGHNLFFWIDRTFSMEKEVKEDEKIIT
ncbi:Accessory gene regulator B [Desulfofarcimen acetoxidans DSM 771]|uniref:Accessory gene regulator B n=1 Tax=Desulfofarcimen acetoxidans (strain ATCC 49208 / DSM 771 / KCTC 5769 / VKM B-1644 / 5575) TaxID=485916 RepID=C8W6P2_DESAS|nr:accessory gene regulator B family protein [Desulfofarcimen acetoxidans]ACV64151.1 Accessory gene regulator B [Desulfofarcimen acetoxidans DSM 771]